MKRILAPLLACMLVAVVALAQAECDKKKCPLEATLNHYVAKGCKPVMDKDNCCPDSYDCGDYEKGKPEDGCQFKGRTYKQGETIETTNPCHTCKCGPNGVSGCAVIECFSEISQPRCIPLFDHAECCPKNYYCLSPERKSLEEVTDTTTCKWEGKTYVDSQIIDISDEPCVTCICKPGFNGSSSPSCKRVECPFPGNNLKMKRGCCPVYMESRCCSVDWMCPPPEELEPQEPAEKPVAGSCKFGKRYIAPGKELDLQDPCTSCKCITPPDLTCIRQQCKGPPENNFARCRPIPKEGQCCPDFQCLPPGANPMGFEGGPPFPRPDQPAQPPAQTQ